jgi:hypothetical protein
MQKVFKIEIGQMFHFKRFFPMYTCKNSFPSYDPLPTLEDFDLYVSLNLHYVRKFDVNMNYSDPVVLENSYRIPLAE